jgi:D-alanyl-D-alanine carboxypeptidase
MRKVISLIGLLALVFTIASIRAVAKDEKTMTWKGYISDSVCGVKNADTAAGKQCATQCVKEKGASWVFVDAKSKKVLKIHNQDAVNADKDLGMEIVVTGHVMEDGMLHLDKITMGKM